MKKLEICLLCCLCLLLLSGCKRYDRLGETPAPVVVTHPSAETAAADQEDADSREETDPQLPSIVELTTRPDERAPAVKVKGIYLTAYAAGNTSRMDEIIGQIDKTEINTVVIDVKDDSGRVTFAMDSPLVSEAGSVQNVMEIGPLMKKLKEHHIYTIARVVAFKDPYVTKTHPEWGLRLANGELYKDNSGQTWLNPYKEEVWDYLIEICVEAHKAGFDEVQCDYLRFATEKNVKDVVYEDADTQGRDKKEVITQFVEHAYERLHSEGIYMAADVFGAIIGGGIDSDAVGQSYGNMANILDYICPMIYPSHYGDGNFGVSGRGCEHPVRFLPLQGAPDRRFLIWTGWPIHCITIQCRQIHFVRKTQNRSVQGSPLRGPLLPVERVFRSTPSRALRRSRASSVCRPRRWTTAGSEPGIDRGSSVRFPLQAPHNSRQPIDPLRAQGTVL